METKICTKCGVEKPLFLFHFRRRGSDKRIAACKKCDVERNTTRKGVVGIADLPGEIWLPSVGMEDTFVTSNTGRIRRISVAGFPTNRLRVPQLTENGYLATSIKYNKKHKFILIHRAVAMAFVPNPLNLPEVNHKDGDKTNNNDWNLEWCTNEENIQHSWEMGLRKPPSGSKNGASKVTESEVLDIREIGYSISLGEIAGRFGVSKATVCNILKRKTWTHI